MSLEGFVNKIVMAVSIASYSGVVAGAMTRIAAIDGIDPTVLSNIEMVTYKRVINTPAQCTELVSFIMGGQWQDIGLPVVADFSPALRVEILNCIGAACNEILQVPLTELQGLIAAELPVSE